MLKDPVIDISVRAPVSPRWTIFAIYTTLFLDFAGFSVALPLLPDILKHYLQSEGYSPALAYFHQAVAEFSHDGSLLMATVLFAAIAGACYAFFQFLFSDVLDLLSNYLGRKAVLLTTLTASAGGYILWMWAGSFEYFLLSRILTGAMAANLSAANSAIADLTDVRTRTRALSHGSIAITAGFSLGPAMGIAATLLWAPPASSVFAPWALNPFSGAAALMLGLTLFDIALIARFLPWRMCLPIQDRNEPAHILPNPHPIITRIYFLYFCYNMLYSGATFAFAFLTLQRFGLSMRENSILFLAIGIGVLLIQGWGVPKILQWRGAAASSRAAIGAGVFGFAFMGWSHDFGTFLLGCAAVAFFVAVITPSLMILLSYCVPVQQEGRTLGKYRSIGALGRSGGTLLFGLVYFKFGALATFSCATAGLIPLLLLTRKLPRHFPDN